MLMAHCSDSWRLVCDGILSAQTKSRIPLSQRLCVMPFCRIVSRFHRIDRYCAENARQHMIVAGTPKLQQQCAEAGYPKAQVLATSGMVINPSFHCESAAEQQEETPEAAADGGAAEERLRVLVCYGAHPPMRVEAIVTALLEAEPSLEIVALCGGNEALLKALKARGDCVAEPMVPSERVTLLMRWASLVVGKPGPGVVTEACACGTAFLTERKGLMAQEVDVLAWVEGSGVGIALDDLTDLTAMASGRLAESVRACLPAAAAQKQSNRAVFEVADLLRSLISTTKGEIVEQAAPEVKAGMEVEMVHTKASPAGASHRRTISSDSIMAGVGWYGA